MNFSKIALTAAFTMILISGVSEAKQQKFSLWRKPNALNCNVFMWYTSSWSTTSSTSSDSCDYLVPLVKNKDEELHKFVEVNRDRLMEEMGQGQGPVLNDYASLLGCPSEAIPAFNKASQENFSSVFSGAQDASDILKNTRENLGNVKEIREKCTVNLS